MANETWKPPLPVSDRTQAAQWQSLSQWLKVPCVSLWRLTYNGSAGTGIYADMPSASSTMTFRKMRDSSRLLLDVRASAFAAAVTNTCTVGIQLNGTDYTCAFQVFGVANVHTHFTGANVADGVPAGVYTIKLRWSRSGTITVDGNDAFVVTVTETNAPGDT